MSTAEIKSRLMEQLEDRFVTWAKGRPDIRAAIVIGSRARIERPADAWSSYFNSSLKGHLERSCGRLQILPASFVVGCEYWLIKMESPFICHCSTIIHSRPWRLNLRKRNF